MAYLLVENETSIELTGYLDGAGNLQLSHSSGNLVDNDDALQAEDPGATIRIKLMDFSSGGTWVLNATHSSGAGPVTWTRGTDHAYHDFSEYMANFLTVTVTANDGTTSKEKTIDVKTKPEDALPDIER